MLTLAQILLAAGAVTLVAGDTVLAAGFQGLGLLGDSYSYATGVSADGSVAVGYSRSQTSGSSPEAFRWEDGTRVGLGFLVNEPFYFSTATGVSADGSVIAGIADQGANETYKMLGFRWEGGMVALPGSSGFGDYGFAVSDDGAVVVGRSDANEASLWTNSGRTGLGFPSDASWSHATSVSADGSVVVGLSSSNSGYEAFRWEDGTMVGLGFPVGGTQSIANDVNADGSVIVGWTPGGAFRWENDVMTTLPDFHNAMAVNADGSVIVGDGTVGSGLEAAIWDASLGVRSIREVLVDDFGLDLTGWDLQKATGISADGKVIVGTGINPAGGTEAWIARLTQDFRWDNAAGGDWDAGDNWSASEAPGASDTAVFELPDTYTVALTAPVQTAEVRVEQGDVTYDLAGHAMDLGSVTVGSVPGQSAILRVPDVEHFNAESIVVGGDENAPSALVLGPEDANPVGSGAGDPGNDSIGSGAFVPTTSLVVGHRAQTVVQNVTGELGSITVQPSNVPLPFPDITDERARLTLKKSNLNINGDVVVNRSHGDEAGTDKGITVAFGSLDALAMKFHGSALVKGVSRITTLQFLAGLPPGSIQPQRASVEIIGDSVVEILPGGTAIVGDQGEAEVKVMDGSTFQAVGADVTVGGNGSGMIEITAQSSMTAESLTLGKNPGSAGEVAVSSTTDTSTVTAPQINVAEQGSGVLRVEDGGRVDSQMVRVGLQIGAGSGSSSDSIASGQQLPDGAGQLIVNGTGLVSAETIEVGTLGEVFGTGTIEVTEGVFNSGKVKPGASPGTLTIIGPYTQSADGELEIEFSGTLSGQYDVLAVEGDATIDGTVALQFIDGFAPQQGQQFEFLTATGLADFSGAAFEVRNLEPGFMFDITPSAGGIMMTALNDGVFVRDPIPGDYNGDGTVDAADYVVWRKDPDGFGGESGFNTWRTNFSRTAGGGSAGDSLAKATVPEPASALLLLVAGFFCRSVPISRPRK